MSHLRTEERLTKLEEFVPLQLDRSDQFQHQPSTLAERSPMILPYLRLAGAMASKLISSMWKNSKPNPLGQNIGKV